MAIDPELYNTTTTSWERINMPRGVLPIPYRASLLEGWYCKDFVDESRQLYQRRRRRGRNGMMERWFIMTEFKTERVETEPYANRGPSEFLPPSDDENRTLSISYMIHNMLWDLIDELDFACKSGVSRDTIRVLYRIRWRATEGRRILRELDREPIKRPELMAIAQTVQ